MQKEVLALRDDIKKFFTNLVLLTGNKLTLLEKINTNESQKRFYLSTDKINELLESIEDDKELFDKLNLIDFNVQELIDNICKIIGIENDDFVRFLSRRDEKIFLKYKNLINEIDRILTSLSTSRDNLITDMNGKLSHIKSDINSFSNTLRMKKDLI